MSNYIVHVQVDEPYVADLEALHAAAQAALVICGAGGPGAFTVQIQSAEAVHALNRDYAGSDYATDVLSFPAEDEDYAVEEGEPTYLGDIIIAHEVAEQQAREAGLPLQVELMTLVIHGTLHLLGYDHDNPERQAEMWALQSAALDQVRRV